MPAIDLVRLRQQVTRLSEFFFLPPEFVRHLHELLNLYTNPTLRLTQASSPFSLSTYRTSPIILRAIQQEMRVLAASYPQYALELADRLWQEEILEMRLLAAFLLGAIPPQSEVLLARLIAWLSQARDPQLRTALLEGSLARLRRELPDQFLSLVAEWLHPQRPHLWENGLRALIPLLREEHFENFPAVFNLLRPVLENAP
ncbi:MAG: DNA alkylation repair protein, partial [Anaerolineales bacterium]